MNLVYYIKKIYLSLLLLIIVISNNSFCAEKEDNSLNKSFKSCNYLEANVHHLAESLYPSPLYDIKTQEIVSTFFKVALTHKKESTFMGQQGPSMGDLNYCQEPIAFLTKNPDQSLSLFFFNWPFTLTHEMYQDTVISKLYGSPVFRIDNFPKNQLTLDDSSSLPAFNLLNGVDFFASMKQLKKQYTNSRFLDKKAFSNPNQKGELYKALGKYGLTVINPNYNDFLQTVLLSLPPNAENDPILKNTILDIKAKAEMMILTLLLHEPVHIKQSNDLITGQYGRRPMVEQYTQSLHNLFTSPQLEALNKTLYNFKQKTFCFFSNYYALTHWTEKAQYHALRDLEDIQNLIAKMNLLSPELSLYYQTYEYVEGIAEYIKYQSLLDVGKVNFNQVIDMALNDYGNALFYRTGAIAALFMRNQLSFHPFQKGQDRSNSIWSILISEIQNKDIITTNNEFKKPQCLLNIPTEHSEAEIIHEYILQGKSYKDTAAQ